MVFSILVNYYFKVSFNLKVILYMATITQNTVIALLQILMIFTVHNLEIWGHA